MRRRDFELICLTIVLVEVARTGIVKLWAKKAVDSTAPDSLTHKTAEVGLLLT